jgi:hypothetical protein
MTQEFPGRVMLPDTRGLMSDLTILFRMGPPAADWSVGSWTTDHTLYDQSLARALTITPDDHP